MATASSTCSWDAFPTPIASPGCLRRSPELWNTGSLSGWRALPSLPESADCVACHGIGHNSRRRILMAFVGKIFSAAAVGLALMVVAVGLASAQEISATKLAIAKQVAKNAPALGNFDGILPDLMVDTKMRLINLRPDLYKQISTAVEAAASALVPRRNDRENDHARASAKGF